MEPPQPSRYATARQFIQGGYQLAIWCPQCEVWRVVNLAEMVMRGRGDERLIGRRWVCRDCSSVGQAQVRAPAPGSPGYEPCNKAGGGV